MIVRNLAILAAMALGTATFPVACLPASEEAPFVAIVNKGRGTAYYDHKSESLKEGTRLRAGWRLTCDRKYPYLIIHFTGGAEKSLKPGGPPYLVPNVPQRSDSLSHYFEPVSREQGVSAHIYSPPENGGVVNPKTIVFRWVPSAALGRIRLIIRYADRLLDDKPPIWANGGIEGGAGQYTSPEAREALSSLRESDPDAKLELRLVDQRGNAYSVGFEFLGKEEEKEVEKELSKSSREEGPIRYINRAFVFHEHRLFYEEAEAFEAAVSRWPDSRDLRLAAMNAQARIGNTARAAHHRALLR